MFHFLCVLFKRLQDDEKCSNLHMCMLVTHKNGPKIMYCKNDSKSLYYRAVGIAYLFLLFVLSVDSASGAFASNDEGAVMDTGGV